MIILILLVITLIIYNILVGWIALRSCNQSPLEINTFDGSNCPYHPSVLYNERGYDPSGKYKYILSETPFNYSLPSEGKYYRDQFECPSVHYSHDGIIWEQYISNPIDDLSDFERDNRDYFSDPELVKTDVGIECWYRVNRRYGKVTNQENISILRKTSADGIIWSKREEIVNLELSNPNSGLGRVVISPTLLYDSGIYRCWYVDNISKGKENICYAEYINNKWTDKELVQLRGPEINPWHIHVLYDNGIYWLTVYDHEKLSLWKGSTEKQFEFVKNLLFPSKIIGSFYFNNLYRACLIHLSSGNYRLYFSADDMFNSYVGIMEGNSPESMEVVSVNDKLHSSFKRYIKMLFKTNYVIITRKPIYYTKRIISILREKFKV